MVCCVVGSRHDRFLHGAGFAAELHVYQEGFGPDGTGGTHFEDLAAAGVDECTGDVYDEEAKAGTVEKFNSVPETVGWNAEGHQSGLWSRVGKGS